MIKISPSILSCDFANLKSDIDTVISDIDYIHIDVMDGLFVNNISFGIHVIKSIRPYFTKLFDTHLMIVNPERYIEAFSNAGADLITFHYEAAVHHHRIVQQIHSLGKKAGISIVPSTPVSSILPILPCLQ